MNLTADKLKQARDAGYSDDEIWGFVAEQDDRFTQAKDSGYSLDEVSGFFSEQPEAEQTKTQVATESPVGTSFMEEVRQIPQALQQSIEQPLEAVAETTEVLGAPRVGAALRGLTEAPEGYVPAAQRFMEPQEGEFQIGGFAPQFLPRAIVEQGAQVVGSIASSAAGRIVGGLVGSVAGPVGRVTGATVGQFLGPALFEMSQIVGPAARERAKNQGREEPTTDDLAWAWATAGASGALNAIGARYLPNGDKLTGPLSQRIATTIAGEGSTEGLQNIVQQTGQTFLTESGFNIEPKEAIGETIIGGGAGGAATLIAAPFAPTPEKKAEVAAETVVAAQSSTDIAPATADAVSQQAATVIEEAKGEAISIPATVTPRREGETDAEWRARTEQERAETPEQRVARLQAEATAAAGIELEEEGVGVEPPVPVTPPVEPTAEGAVAPVEPVVEPVVTEPQPIAEVATGTKEEQDLRAAQERDRIAKEAVAGVRDLPEDSPEVVAAYTERTASRQNLVRAEVAARHPNSKNISREEEEFLAPLQALAPLRPTEEPLTEGKKWRKGEEVGYNENVGTITKAIPPEGQPNTLYRVVTREDYERILANGQIDSDMRLAITADEGINLTPKTSTATYYLPRGETGVVLAIDPTGLDLNFIQGDSYVRSFKPIPADRIVGRSDFIHKDAETGEYLLRPQDNAPVTNEPTSIINYTKAAPTLEAAPAATPPPEVEPTPEAVTPTPNLEPLRRVARAEQTEEDVSGLVGQGLVELYNGQPVITQAGLETLPEAERPRLNPEARKIQIDTGSNEVVAEAISKNLRIGVDQVGPNVTLPTGWTLDGDIYVPPAAPEVRESRREPAPLTQQDREYLDAVERGDLDAGSRAVNEAAKSAGYTIKAYHGTTEPDITVFSGRLGSAVHVALNKNTARSYADNYLTLEAGQKPSIYEVFVNVKNTFDARNPDHFNQIGLRYPKDFPWNYKDLEENINVIKAAGFDSYFDYEDSANTKPDGIAVFNERMVKLSNTITKDDRGNIIPPSQRFQTREEDIRYSLAERGQPKESQVVSIPDPDFPNRVSPKEYHKLNSVVVNQYGDTATDVSKIVASMKKQASSVKDKVYGKKFLIKIDGQETEYNTPSALQKALGPTSDGAIARVYRNGNNQIVADFEDVPSNVEIAFREESRFARREPSVEARQQYAPKTEEEQASFDKASSNKVLARSPQLAVAAVRMKNGEITAGEYADLVDAIDPFTAKGADPIPTKEKIQQYISSDKAGQVMQPIESGKEVEFRIDIPTYNRSTAAGDTVYAVTAHEPVAADAKGVGKVISFVGVAKVKNPTFMTRAISGRGTAADIAAGAGKFPLATVKGNYEPITDLPADINDPNIWTEVGYNPIRSSFFVDVRSKDAVVGGSEAIMVGSRVFVKDAVLEPRPTGVTMGERYAKIQMPRPAGMETEAVTTKLESLGFGRGGIVSVVNEPDASFEGRTIIRDGKVVAIELNAAALKDDAAVERVLNHEIAESANADGALNNLVAGLTPKERKEINDAITRLGYAEKARTAEEAARAVELLAEGWRGRKWFDRAVARIEAWANKLGYKLTRRAAEYIAARNMAEVNDAFRKMSTADALANLRGARKVNFNGLSAVLIPPSEMEFAYSIAAYHGTPHEIQGRFQLAKIGTGEGALAYGWGLYFAENRAVAEGYRTNLSRGDELVLYTAQGTKRGDSIDELDRAVAKYLIVGEETAGQFKYNTAFYAKQRAEAAGRQDVVFRIDEYGNEARAGYEKITGNLYTVDLDVEPDELLDWDQPINKQGERIESILRGLPTPKWYDSLPDGARIEDRGTSVMGSQRFSVEGLPNDIEGFGPTRESAIDMAMARLNEGAISPELTGNEFYNALAKIYRRKNPEGLDMEIGASIMLRDLGIKGIQYLDQGSRAPKLRDSAELRKALADVDYLGFATAGAAMNAIKKHPDWETRWDVAGTELVDVVRRHQEGGTRNYVIFDENVIKITARNGQEVDIRESRREDAIPTFSEGSPEASTLSNMKESMAKVDAASEAKGGKPETYKISEIASVWMDQGGDARQLQDMVVEYTNLTPANAKKVANAIAKQYDIQQSIKTAFLETPAGVSVEALPEGVTLPKEVDPDRPRPVMQRLFDVFMGVRVKPVKITGDEKALLKSQIRLKAAANRAAKQEQQRTADEVVEIIKSMELRGPVRPKQAQALAKRAAKVIWTSEKSMENFVEYAAKVVENANYDADLREAKATQKRAKELSKQKRVAMSPQRLILQQIGNVAVNKLDDPRMFAEMINYYLRGFKDVRSPDYVVVPDEEITGYISQLETESVKDQAEVERETNERLARKYDLDPNTIPELMSLINIIEEIEGRENREALESILTDKAIETQDGLRGYDTTALTNTQKKLVESMLGVDLKSINNQEKQMFIRIANNMIYNNQTNGAEYFVATAKGQQNARKAAQDSKMIQRNKAWIPLIPSFGSLKLQETLRNFSLELQSVADTFRNVFGKDFMAKAYEMMGMLDLNEGFTKANNTIDEIQDLMAEFHQGNEEKYGDAARNQDGILSEGVAGFLIQEFPFKDEATSIQQRRNLINEYIANARESRQKDRVAMADRVEAILNKVDGASVQEILNNMKREYRPNYDSLMWYKDVLFPKYKDFLKQFDENFNDQANNYDSPNYLPIAFTSAGPALALGPEDVSIANSISLQPKQSVYTIKRQDYTKLPKDRDGNPKEIEFNLRRAAFNSLSDQINKAYTNPAWQQIFAFMKTPESVEFFGDKANRDFFVDRLNRLRASRARRGSVSGGALEKALDSFSIISRKLGTGIALGGVFQWIKQPPDQLLTALGSGGRADLLAKNIAPSTQKAARELLNQFSIGRRGDSSAGYKYINQMEGHQSRMERYFSESKWEQAKEQGGKIADVWMVALKKSDFISASAAWMTYYEGELNKNDIKIDDWAKEAELVKTDPVRRQAAAYAEQMTDIYQGSSDPTSMATFAQSGKTGWENFTKALLVPFNSFAIQQRMRLYSDARDALNGTSGGKGGLAGTIGGLILFHTTKRFVLPVISGGTAAILYGMLGVDMEEPDEEKQKEMADRNWRQFLADITGNLLVGGTPQLVENRTIEAFNYASYMVGLQLESETVMDENGEIMSFDKYSKERSPFYRYKSYDNAMSLGMFDIGFDQAKETALQTKMLMDRDEMEMYTPEEQRLLYFSALSEWLYLMRLNDTDFARIVKKARRDMIKAAEEREKELARIRAGR